MDLSLQLHRSAQRWHMKVEMERWHIARSIAHWRM
jgi:hypothetical protein